MSKQWTNIKKASSLILWARRVWSEERENEEEWWNKEIRGGKLIVVPYGTDQRISWRNIEKLITLPYVK